MTKKLCWRYKCDFCGKVGYSAGHMKGHEKHCTANPDRACRSHKFCDHPPTLPDNPPMPELQAALRSCGTDWVAGLAALRVAAHDCPACILAALRQSGLQKGVADEDGYAPGVDFGFNFKEEMEKKFAEFNESQRENESVYSY
jgi:hypothetical protein